MALTAFASLHRNRLALQVGLCAGDVNGYGIADVIVGAFPINSFRYDSYVVFGSREGFPATVNSSSSPQS